MTQTKIWVLSVTPLFHQSTQAARQSHPISAFQHMHLSLRTKAQSDGPRQMHGFKRKGRVGFLLHFTPVLNLMGAILLHFTPFEPMHFPWSIALCFGPQA